MPELQNQDGQSVRVGDLIRVARTRRARIESVFAAGMSDAADSDCSDTGGVLIKLADSVD